jgi:hypothetical protein
MRRFLFIAAAAIVAASPVAAAMPDTWDGLVHVDSRRMDAAFLLPGADFRPYKKVMIDEPEVAFRPNWLRDVNRSRTTGRVTEADAARILEAFATGSAEVFATEFKAAGYEVVTKPGPDVLRLRTAVININVNAPDVRSAGRSRTFTANAGDATLILEARDSPTNTLLARAADRRETRNIAGQANRVTNTADFRLLVRDWARISARKLGDLKALSPVPDPLKPGQRLQ